MEIRENRNGRFLIQTNRKDREQLLAGNTIDYQDPTGRSYTLYPLDIIQEDETLAFPHPSTRKIEFYLSTEQIKKQTTFYVPLSHDKKSADEPLSFTYDPINDEPLFPKPLPALDPEYLEALERELLATLE